MFYWQDFLRRASLRRSLDLRHRPGSRRAVAAIAACLVAAAVEPALASDFRIGQIEIDQPWSRATPGGAKVAGGYVVIDNKGSVPDRLVSVTAEIAGRVEIHAMSVKDGIMSMRPLPDGLPVPANGSVALKPGSYHLMFHELKRPLKAGDEFSAALTFAKAGTAAVRFTVEAIGAPGPRHDRHSEPPSR